MNESQLKTAVFANGCFWCTEAVFQMLNEVHTVKPGYTGGAVQNPSYDQVCGGATGHAEGILIEYDPFAVYYKDLLTVFFNTHDPTTLNRPCNDVGTQYRSAIFYHNEAENYHYDHYKNHTEAGYCQVIIAPKIEKMQKRFAELIKTE